MFSRKQTGTLSSRIHSWKLEICRSMRDLVALQLVIQRRAVNAQGGRGFLHITMLSLQRSNNGSPLQFPERNVGHFPILRVPPRALQPGEICSFETAIAARHNG